MNKFTTIVTLFLIVFFPSIICHAQDIMVIPGDTVLAGTLGSEMIVCIYVVNISSFPQTIFMARTENDLPEGWTSSLCFNGSCFAPYVDSVFSFEPVYPQDTLEASIHFSSDVIKPGNAHVQIQIEVFNNPDTKKTLNLSVSTFPAAVNEQVDASFEFRLMQNYPNPFNPFTRIMYSIPRRSNICLKIYNITGCEIKTLVNEVKNAGIYNVSFDGRELASGSYLYLIIADKFTAAREMSLIK